MGIQSSAIIVQGLANGSLELKDSGKQIMKEMGVGLFNALIISLVVFAYAVIFHSTSISVPISVALSVFSVVIFASIFGTFVPLTLERFNIDPALATGPFITITNDIVGVVIYMAISSALINALGAAL